MGSSFSMKAYEEAALSFANFTQEELLAYEGPWSEEIRVAFRSRREYLERLNPNYYAQEDLELKKCKARCKRSDWEYMNGYDSDNDGDDFLDEVSDDD